MKSFLIIFTFICISIQVNSQSFFAKIYGGLTYDHGNSAKQTTDGGYIICGSSYTTDYFGYIIKTDMLGDTIWTKKYGDSLSVFFNDIHLSLDGGYVVVGTKKKDEVIINANNQDLIFVKINAVGDTLWKKEIGGPREEVGEAIIPLADSTYIITGWSNPTVNSGFEHLYLVKANKSGDTLWQKIYGDSITIGYGIDTTNDGGFIIAGKKGSYLTGYTDILLVKTNNVGDTLWTKTFDNSNYDGAYSVKQTPDFGYIICGYTMLNNGDAYIIKTDSLGNVKWTKTIGTTKRELLNSVQVTSDENYIFAGNANNDVLVIKTDSLGTLIWRKIYGDSIYYNGSYIGETPNKGFFVAGYTLDSNSVNIGDVFLIKSDSLATGFANMFLSVVNETIIPNTINTFPNPASENFTLTIGENFSKNMTLSIYDSMGNLLSKENVNDYSVCIKRNNLVNGIYLLKLQDENGLIETRKIIFN